MAPQAFLITTLVNEIFISIPLAFWQDGTLSDTPEQLKIVHGRLNDLGVLIQDKVCVCEYELQIEDSTVGKVIIPKR